MWAEQAIFTSMRRRGREGYHLVSRSRGVGESDAQDLARWAPSHGALLMDGRNRASVNFHPLPSGRFALSRTCAGPAEYSGRGGHQLYTHTVIVDEPALHVAAFQPFSLYRCAMAIGCNLYQPEPDEDLEPVRLSPLYPRRDPRFWADRAAELNLPPLRPLCHRLQAGQSIRLAHAGDRAALAECLIGMLPRESVRCTSFSTSLVPSAARPFLLTLVDETLKSNPRS